MKIFSNLKILIPYIKNSKRYFIWGLLGIIFVSAIVAPVPYLIGKVLDIVLEKNVTFFDIRGILIFLLLIYFTKFFVNIIYQYLFAKLQQNVVNEIRLSMFERLIDAPLSFINKREKVTRRKGNCRQTAATIRTKPLPDTDCF